MQEQDRALVWARQDIWSGIKELGKKECRFGSPIAPKRAQLELHRLE